MRSLHVVTMLAVTLTLSAPLEVAAAPQAAKPAPPPTAPAAKPSPAPVAPAASTTAPAKKRTAALLPLAAVGIDEGARAKIQADLRTALGARGVKLQSPEATAAHIAASRLSCLESDTGCLVKLGFIATADDMIAGRLEPAPGGHKIVLHLVDVEGARQVKRVEDLLAADPAGRAADLERITGELLGAEPIGGDIRISCDKPGAVVLIDGVKVGLTPLSAPVKGLVRGRHTIEVRLAGHKSFQGHADVENGQTVEINVVMISMIDEDEVVVATGPLETTEVREVGPAPAPEGVNLVPMVLLVGGAGALIVGIVGLVVGTGGLGYALYLNEAVRTDPVGEVALAQQQDFSAYAGFAGLGVMVVGVLAGGALIATSFLVE